MSANKKMKLKYLELMVVVRKLWGGTYILVKLDGFFFFFFFFKKFLMQCSIAVHGRLTTTSSLHGPQGPDCPITGKRHYQYQRRNLTSEERELNTGCS